MGLRHISPALSPTALALALFLAWAPTAHGGEPIIDDDNWVFGDTAHHNRPQVLNISVGTLPDRLGLALWYAIPISNDGMLPRTNDAVLLEFGGVLGAYYGDNYWRRSSIDTRHSVIAAVGPKWNLYLTRAWTLYSTLKLGINLGLDGYAPDLLELALGVGAEYRLKSPMSLRLELGYPLGLSVGLSFDIGGG